MSASSPSTASPSPATPVHTAVALRFRVMYLLVAVSIFIADQVTKSIIQRLPEDVSLRVIPHLFRIVHVENTGVAFGLFQDAPPQWRILLIVGSSLALLLVLGLMWRSQQSLRTGIALSMILGGAVGNLSDRILHGRVVDFLLFYIGPHTWPAFNLADSAIVVGAGILVWEILRDNRSSTPAGEA